MTIEITTHENKIVENKNQSALSLKIFRFSEIRQNENHPRK